MTLNRRDFALLTLAATLTASSADAQTGAPVVIARRGASGDWPEATRGAYEAAISDGADFIEASLVAAKDGALVVRPDHELSASTDVASRPEFADRKTTKTLDGVAVDGWFTEDFTLAELKTLGFPGGGKHKDKGPPPAILTLQDVIDIARAGSVRMARVVGVCARLVHSGYFNAIGLALEPPLADAIRTNGYNAVAAAMWVESFEATSLKTLATLSHVRRMQLVGAAGGPPDQPDVHYTDMLSADGLKTVRTYAQAIGLDQALALDLNARPAPAAAPLVDMAHAAGLGVYVQTATLPGDFPPRPFRKGDVRGYLQTLFAARIDGLTADSASVAVRARGDALRGKHGGGYSDGDS